MTIRINLDVMMAKRKIGVGRAKAVRFTTLDAICKALDCQPGDILEWEDDD